jgi:beta-phosphoglucomutase-like phosphatase (HAD superfamily)
MNPLFIPFYIFILITYLSCHGIAFTVHQNVKQIQVSSTILNAMYDLIIWDCDGVLVDSEALLKQGEVEALAKAGIKVTIEDCVALFSGFSPDAATENFLKVMGKPLPNNFFKEQIEGSLQLFKDRLEPLMKETVLKLHNNKILMCVASGSPRNRVDISIEKGGMSTVFPSDRIFTREEVKRGKPAPDLFLLASKKLDVPPEKCIVVEDSSAGIEAAIAANMAVIGFLGGGHAQSTRYREKILSYEIPITYNQEEVFLTLKPLVLDT